MRASTMAAPKHQEGAPDQNSEQVSPVGTTPTGKPAIRHRRSTQIIGGNAVNVDEFIPAVPSTEAEIHTNDGTMDAAKQEKRPQAAGSTMEGDTMPAVATRTTTPLGGDWGRGMDTDMSQETPENQPTLPPSLIPPMAEAHGRYDQVSAPAVALDAADMEMVQQARGKQIAIMQELSRLYRQMSALETERRQHPDDATIPARRATLVGLFWRVSVRRYSAVGT